MLDNISSMRSSLNAQQTRLDIIANNIANISATGYKKSQVSFGDAFYKTMYGPGMPVSQSVRCGAGVMVSGTEKDFSEGTRTSTGRELDLAIAGEGFFGVLLPDGSMGYTRAGNFYLDGEQYLVNAQGARLYTDMMLPEEYSAISISSSGEITAQTEDGTASVVGSIPLFHVPNPAGLKALGDGLYQETDASGAVSMGTAGSDGLGSIKQGYLEQSNVDLGEEMVNMIAAQRSFQFSAQAMRTLDEMWGLANGLQR